VNTDRPGIFSIVERKKWCSKNILNFDISYFFRDSWKAVEGMSADEAKQNYIEALLEMFDNAGGQVNFNK
jgi:acyl-CoA-binding protein